MFATRLRDAFPLRYSKVMAALEDCRVTQAASSSFGTRMHCAGARWGTIHSLFELHARKHGLATGRASDVEPLAPDVAPHVGTGPSAHQAQLFDA